MRITYLSSSVVPSRSANSVHVMKMCAAFSRNGHEVTLVGFTGDGSSASSRQIHDRYGTSDRFRIVRFPRPSNRPGWLNYSRRCHGLLRRHRPDLVYGRSLPGLLGAWTARVPFVYESHAPPKSSWHGAIERILLRSPSFLRLVVISGALRGSYQQRFPGLDPDRLLVAHDAADHPRPSPDRRDELGWPGRDGLLQVGYTGHLYPGKGLEIILQLAGRMDDVDFHVVGGTRDDLDRYRSSERPRNLHLHGHVPHASVASLVQRFDIALAPYQRRVSPADGRGNIAPWMSPLKLFEYMAARRPIIASDLPVIREILTHRRTALLASPEDAGEWEQAIRTLLSDERLREEIATNAYEQFRRHHTWTRRAEAVLEGIDVAAITTA